MEMILIVDCWLCCFMAFGKAERAESDLCAFDMIKSGIERIIRGPHENKMHQLAISTV